MTMVVTSFKYDVAQGVLEAWLMNKFGEGNFSLEVIL